MYRASGSHQGGQHRTRGAPGNPRMWGHHQRQLWFIFMWFPAPRLGKMKGQRSLTPAAPYFPIFVASGKAEAQGPVALVPVTPRSFRAVHEGFLLCPSCYTPANASPHSQHHPRSCLHGSLDCPWQQLETLLNPPVGDHWVGSPRQGEGTEPASCSPLVCRTGSPLLAAG